MPNEKEILKRLSEGEKDMFSYIFDTYYNDLCKYVYVRFIKDKDESEEVVQNLFVKIWENRDKLLNIDSLKSYLYRSAYNACINYLQHQAVIKKYQDEAWYKLKQFEFSLMEDHVEDDKIVNVTDAINELPEQTKRIFILKYINGLKYKEIAAELNISDKTVQTLIYRGLKQLRNKLLIIFILIFLEIKVLIELFINSK